jgi:hypothetical protein
MRQAFRIEVLTKILTISATNQQLPRSLPAFVTLLRNALEPQVLFRVFIASLWLLICSAILDSKICFSQEVAAGLRFVSLTKATHGQVLPGGTLVLVANLHNSSDEPLQGTIVAAVEGRPDTQSARTITFLPHQDERLEVYVQVPTTVNGQDYAVFELTLYTSESGKEMMVDVDGVPMRHSLRLPVGKNSNRAFAVIEAEPPVLPYWYWPPQDPHSNYEWAVASRVASNNTRAMVNLSPGTVPLNRADWGKVAIAIVSDPRLFDDGAAVEALSRFVNNGGCIWIMVDQVPCSIVRPLLHDGQSCEELDEIELNAFSIDVSLSMQSISPADRSVSLDKPARMKRVIQHGGQVSHEVNGWPLAIWMQVGYGKILLTTLESHAWVVPGSESSDPLRGTTFKNRLWALSVATEANDILREKPLATAVEYPMQLFGNPVLPRRLVGGILLAFVCLLALVGALQWRLGEISRFGWAAPLLSLAAGCSLFIASSWIRRDIPETAASLQLVQVSEDGNTASVREQGAIYLNSEKAMELASSSDGWAVANEDVKSGIKRYLVEDFQHWKLSNGAWPMTWRYQSENVLDSDNLVARGTLSENGLSIKLPESVHLDDPIVSLVPGAPMIGLKVEGEITADGSLQAENDRWINGSIISDEQRRRIEVYQEFFRPDNRVPTLSRTIYGWTDRWKTAEWSDQALTIAGSALVSIPISIARPAIGQKLLLPAGMLQIRRDLSAETLTSVFSDVTGKWTPSVSIALNSSLQILLPPEVLPFQAESMTFELDIKAPHRTVRLLGRTNVPGQTIEIVTLQGPSIPWKGEVTQPEFLEAAKDGLVDVVLEISEREDLDADGNSNSVVTWQIDSFRASLRGSRTSE